MAKTHNPKRGSHGYSPRVRARSKTPRFASWPEGGDAPKLQGFAGYKAGMTHALVVDYRPKSVTSGQEVQIPVTVLEVPAMRIAAVRFYRETSYGLKTVTEIWAENTDALLKKRTPVPKEAHTEARWDNVKSDEIDDVRVLAYTLPKNVKSIPLKIPDLMEIRVGGGSMSDRMTFAKGLLGNEVNVEDWSKTGEMIDVAAITKGYGFQGSPVRWGVKLQSHKNSKNRRDTSPLGPFQPRFIRSEVPMPGQTGYHHRTEYNKRILKLGDNGDDITPKGGFMNYGVVHGKYILLHGSIPGPAKRLIRLRDATRYTRGIEVDTPELSYISTASKQGR